MGWQALRVSPEGTHHLRELEPAYAIRFDGVLAFHEPGFAAVKQDGMAWHIRTSGNPVYPRRFKQTFGYYEGLAAVESIDGWHHIQVDGSDLYKRRYGWCGNFQGGRCTVRDADGLYGHIMMDGTIAYEARWRYAGDYRDEMAVAQDENGLSTHIDLNGKLVHGAWFLDLDVFHKGFARARDADGWMHIDRKGVPAYVRRFAMVEPFYNGQARVESHDGGLEIIDEFGRTVQVLRGPSHSVFHEVSADLVGFWRTGILGTAVELGVFDALPSDLQGVTATCGLPEDNAERLLVALAEMQYVEIDMLRVWRTTAKGGLLLRQSPVSLAGAALEYAGPLGSRWVSLPSMLRGDATRFPGIFDEVASNRERLQRHHQMLACYAMHDYESLVTSLPISHGEIVLDAAGSTGTLASMVKKQFPDAQVYCGDLPSVASSTRVDGVGLVPLDLFRKWPIRANVVLLGRVLHDWPDSMALQILHHAREALEPGGRLAVLEFLRPDSGYAGGMCDMHLLAVTGGRERRRCEVNRLLHQSGFHVDQIISGDSVPSLLIAKIL